MFRLLASLFFAIPCLAQFAPTPGPSPLFPLSGGTPGSWTMAQNNAEFSGCSATTSCTVTLTSAGTIGNYPVLAFGINNAASVTGVSGGGSTWTVVSNCELNGGGSIGMSYCAWGTPYTSSPTTLTITLGSSATVSGFYYEGNWSGTGSCTLDTAGTQSNSTASTSMPGVPLSITGTSDFIVQLLMTAGGTPSSISSPYGYFHSGSFRGTGAFINAGSGAAPTFTNSTSQTSIVAALALSCTGGAIPTMSLVQSPYNIGCSITTTATTQICSTSAANVATGDGLLVMTTIFVAAPSGNTPSIASITGDTNLTHCPSALQTLFISATNNNAATDCYYAAPAAGGTAPTFKVTWNTPGIAGSSPYGYMDIVVFEVHKSSGTIALDTTNHNSVASCTSTCTASTLTLTGGGANEFLASWGAFDNPTISGPGSPWLSPNPPVLDQNDVTAGFAGAINQTSGTAPVWSTNGTAGYFISSGAAFK
jgi:hypothetical protein